MINVKTLKHVQKKLTNSVLIIFVFTQVMIFKQKERIHSRN